MSACMHQGHAHSKDPVIQLVAVQLPQARHQGREFRDTSVYILRMVVDMFMFYLICLYFTHTHIQYTCMYVHFLFTYMYKYSCNHMHSFANMHLYTYVCTYVHTYIHIDTFTYIHLVCFYMFQHCYIYLYIPASRSVDTLPHLIFWGWLFIRSRVYEGIMHRLPIHRKSVRLATEVVSNYTWAEFFLIDDL